MLFGKNGKPIIMLMERIKWKCSYRWNYHDKCFAPKHAYYDLWYSWKT